MPTLYNVTTHTKLVVRVLQDVIRDQSFTDLGEVAEALKMRCAKLRIEYDGDAVWQALDQLQRGGKIRLTRPAPAPVERRCEPRATGPDFSREEAARICRELRARINTMPAGPQSAEAIVRHVHDRDRLKALRMVQREIVDTIQRTEELERALGQTTGNPDGNS